MSYTIAGRKILNEHIALAVLGTYGAIAVSQMGGSKQATPSASPDAKAANQPPINASSSDEEAFIKQFLADAEKESGRQV
ncbi:hypothetical protein PaG_01484 [Moesziomyces aphidis]|nr:hypothetical protein PaG_01484 [Moesziomyces aphidis]SPO46751.1 uncharacterized protein PSANT_04437 [Moesziomyces antarcticus]